MKNADLPERWRNRLSEWLRKFGHDDGMTLGALDFTMGYTVQVLFDDGSNAQFRYAITIEAPELREIGIFTEHCGYHIFPLGGTHLARVEE